MSEKRSNTGIFWAVLLLVGGITFWGINKAFGAKNDTPQNPIPTPNPSPTPSPTNKTNDATKNGMPYSLNLSLLDYAIDPKYVPKGKTNTGKYNNQYNVLISANGGICLFETNSNGFSVPYLYSPKGTFLSKGNDFPIDINFTKIASINWLFQEPTPYYHAIFFTIKNNYNTSISTSIICHLELSYNGNVISTIDYDIAGGGIKVKKWDDNIISNSPDQPFTLYKSQLPNIYNLGHTLKMKESGTFFLPFWYDDKNVSIQQTHDDFGTKPNYVGNTVNINIKGYIKIAGGTVNINQTLSVPIDSSTNDFAFTKDIYPNYYNTGSNVIYIPDNTANLSAEDSQIIDAANNFAILNEMKSDYCDNIPDDASDDLQQYCMQN